jgi:hypothetical protein
VTVCHDLHSIGKEMERPNGNNIALDDGGGENIGVQTLSSAIIIIRGL